MTKSSEGRGSPTVGRRRLLQLSASSLLIGAVGGRVAAGSHQISYNERVTGVTENEWVFHAEEGDEISIEMRPVDEINDDAGLELLDPNGDRVRSDFHQSGEDGNAVITFHEVERGQSGEYTIVASADPSSDPFEYELFLYEGIPIDGEIEYGETIESELTQDNRYLRDIDFWGYHETYSFEAHEGDELTIEMRPADEVNEDATISLLDPNGNRVRSDRHQSGEDGNAVITFHEVERGQDGEYTIVASGDDDDELFDYELSLYEGIPIDGELEYGESVESELTRDDRYFSDIGLWGYHETYAFEAHEGDTITIEMRPEDEINNDARLSLFDPNGEQVARDLQQSGEDGNAVITFYEVDRGQGGEYIISASGYVDDELFDYELFLYEGIPIDRELGYDEVIESKLARTNRYSSHTDLWGYHETYSFEAHEGDEVTIEMRPADQINDDARLSLFDPNGDRVAADFQQSGSDGNAVISQYEVKEGQDGEYTIGAFGADRTDIFEYEIELILEATVVPAKFDVPSLTPTETTVTPEEGFTVEAEIHNAGDESGTTTVELVLDDEIVFSEDQQLGGGEDYRTTITVGAPDAVGEYPYSVRTQDAFIDGTLTVQEPAAFEITELDPSEETVEEGETVAVSVTVSNTGDQDGDQYITWEIDGEVVAEEQVSVDGGDSTTVITEFDTAELSSGTWDYTVFAEANSASGTLIVEADETDDVPEADDTNDDSQADGTDDESEAEDTDDVSEANGTDDNEIDDDTDESMPGFGIGGALAGLGGVGYLLKHRLSDENTEQK